MNLKLALYHSAVRQNIYFKYEFGLIRHAGLRPQIRVTVEIPGIPTKCSRAMFPCLKQQKQHAEMAACD